jgi:hypothetical protein
VKCRCCSEKDNYEQWSSEGTQSHLNATSKPPTSQLYAAAGTSLK